MSTVAIGKAGRTAAAWLLLATAVACAPEGNEPPDASGARQQVLVEFALPGSTGTPNAAADPAKVRQRVADAILARLDARARASAQV